ncbi:MAG: HIT family protein [Candidatus Krumholzibacteria bacterium]|nr:HIT family protein [Candidatus Krumholzibacteria bacterium]
MIDRQCPFCSPSGVFLENDLAAAIPDRHPIRPGHTLVIPKRHVASFFDLTPEEAAACFELVRAVRARLEGEYSPGGYKIGINIGRAAGQSVMHAHIHVVPMGGGAPRGRSELLERGGG